MSFPFPNFNVPPPSAFPVQSVSSSIQLFLMQKGSNPPGPVMNKKWSISQFQLELLKGAETGDLSAELSSPDTISQIKAKIQKRRCKRKWLRRRKTHLKRQFHDRLAKRHAEIDQRIQAIQENGIEKNKNANNKREIEQNLSHLKKEIQKTEKQIKLFDALLELNRIRKAGMDTTVVLALKEEWEEVLKSSLDEFEKLQSILLEKFNRKTFIKESWNEVLFGEKKAVDGDSKLDHINIRWKWDAFVSDEGSSIPVFWVLPSKDFNINSTTVNKEQFFE